MRSEQEIKSDMVAAKAKYNVSRSEEDAKEIKALQQELIKIITDGALPCEDCGNVPVGIAQQGAINNMIFTYYEIGCSVCNGKRAQAQSREDAVNNWNNNIYIAKKK
mgnify:CR=1 FL=1